MNVCLCVSCINLSIHVSPSLVHRPVHTGEEVGEELIQEESSELKLDEELVEEDSADSEEEGPMFLDLGTLQHNKTNEVRLC